MVFVTVLLLLLKVQNYFSHSVTLFGGSGGIQRETVDIRGPYQLNRKQNVTITRFAEVP